MAKQKNRNKYEYSGYLFILPNFAGFLIFTFVPILASLVLSFTSWDIFSRIQFIGFENYSSMIHDPDFWNAAGNTLFLMLGIPLGMLGSLFLANVLNKKLRGIVVFRTMFYLPTISAGVALLILWKWIYNSDFGLLNSFLSSLGIDGPDWLGSIHWAKPAFIIMTFWIGVGGNNMILYLAALQGISPELYEAGEIDGANAWHKFWSITWPLVSPTSFFIFIMSIIGGFQGGFNAAYVMTRGGPSNATTTLSYYIFNTGFVQLQMGYAAAIAWTMFIAVLVVTLVNWKYGGKVVHY